MKTTARTASRVRRHARIRKRVAGLPERPRLAVFRSHKHLYVQLINDFDQKTVLGGSTASAALRKELSSASKSKAAGGNLKAAEALGKQIAQEAVKRGIKKVVFDRGGYKYHGRIKALADAARQGGLEF